MKVLAGLVLVAAIALAQGSSADTQITRNDENDEAAHVVYLTIVTGNGQLVYCLGTLISNQHILTASACTSDSRFIWIRYGVKNVPNPDRVTETSTVSNNNLLSIINANRYISLTSNIQIISIEESAEGYIPEEAHPIHDFGFYPGGERREERRKTYITPVGQDQCNGDFCGVGEVACSTNLGTPFVSGGRLVGIATEIHSNCNAEASVNNALAFTHVANYANWISSFIGPLNDVVNDQPKETVQVAETVDIIDIVDDETVKVVEAVDIFEIVDAETVQVAEVVDVFQIVDAETVQVAEVVDVFQIVGAETVQVAEAVDFIEIVDAFTA